MDLIELQKLAEQDGIEIDYFDCGRIGLTFYCGDFHIALQPNLTEKVEKLVLAEEYGHCATGALYPLSTCCNPMKKSNIAKCERIAKDYAAKLLIPLEKLIKYKDLTTYELAEEFDVDEETVRTAVKYYKRKGLIEF